MMAVDAALVAVDVGILCHLLVDAIDGRRSGLRGIATTNFIPTLSPPSSTAAAIEGSTPAQALPPPRPPLAGSLLQLLSTLLAHLALNVREEVDEMVPARAVGDALVRSVDLQCVIAAGLALSDCVIAVCLTLGECVRNGRGGGRLAATVEVMGVGAMSVLPMTFWRLIRTHLMVTSPPPVRKM